MSRLIDRSVLCIGLSSAEVEVDVDFSSLAARCGGVSARLAFMVRVCFTSIYTAFTTSVVRIRHFMVDILTTAGFAILLLVVVLLCVAVFSYEHWDAQQASEMGIA